MVKAGLVLLSLPSVLKSSEPCWAQAGSTLLLLGFGWGVWILVGLSGLRSWSVQVFNNEIMQSRSARLTRDLKSSLSALGHSQGCIQTGSSGTDLIPVGKAAALRLIFHQRWVEGVNLCVRVKGVTAGAEYLGCYFPACKVFHVSSALEFSIPAVAFQLKGGMGRERSAGTVCCGDRLGVTGYAGTVSCSLSQLFILPAGIFLKQILPCVLRLGIIEWNHNFFLRV